VIFILGNIKFADKDSFGKKESVFALYVQIACCDEFYKSKEIKDPK